MSETLGLPEPAVSYEVPWPEEVEYEVAWLDAFGSMVSETGFKTEAQARECAADFAEYDPEPTTYYIVRKKTTWEVVSDE